MIIDYQLQSMPFREVSIPIGGCKRLEKRFRLEVDPDGFERPSNGRPKRCDPAFPIFWSFDSASKSSVRNADSIASHFFRCLFGGDAYPIGFRGGDVSMSVRIQFRFVTECAEVRRRWRP